MQLSIPFDTLSYAKRLKSVGFSEDQAEALAELQTWIIEDKLATKNDLAKIAAGLETKIAQTQAGLELRLAELKADIIKWVVGLLIAQTALFVSLVKLF